ncbi:MAG: hypothetical protein Salg2KO_23320 [Salibacteraceae bacterium]
MLIGCSSQPSVHIFSLGIEEKDVESLSTRLEEAGFNAKPNSLPVPPSLYKHTVIFPAIVQDFATIELIESTMASAGYPDPRLVLESELNHYYSTDNIGVYLVNPDFEGTAADLVSDPYALGDEESNPLSYNYFSECPDNSEAQSELNLFPSGVAILEEFVWDETTNTEESVIHDGEWVSDSSTVEVSIFGKGQLFYSIMEHKGSDFFGPYEALTLVHKQGTMDIEACNYTYLDHLEN